MREYTFEEFCQLPMELVFHMSGTKEHYLHKVNKETGVYKITITPVKRNGEFGTPTTIFYFGDLAYDTADQAYVAYMEKACGVTA